MTEIKLSINEVNHAVSYWFSRQLFRNEVVVTNVEYLQHEKLFSIQFQPSDPDKNEKES